MNSVFCADTPKPSSRCILSRSSCRSPSSLEPGEETGCVDEPEAEPSAASVVDQFGGKYSAEAGTT